MERANDASNGVDDLGGGRVIIKTEDDEKVTIKVQKERMADFYFSMNRDEPLRKLMIAFCERLSLGDYRSFRYLLNGSRIRGHQTPNELEMENDDVIDAWIDQIGGASFSWS
nr:PREDICTED: putative small ubiquitin-related modifier 8 [Daucus carota subsp. sativus]